MALNIPVSLTTITSCETRLRSIKPLWNPQNLTFSFFVRCSLHLNRLQERTAPDLSESSEKKKSDQSNIRAAIFKVATGPGFTDS